MDSTLRNQLHGIRQAVQAEIIQAEDLSTTRLGGMEFYAIINAEVKLLLQLDLLATLGREPL